MKYKLMIVVIEFKIMNKMIKIIKRISFLKKNIGNLTLVTNNPGRL